MRLCLLVLLFLFPVLAGAAGWGGEPNRYRVRIDPASQRAFVEADLWQESDTLSMYNVDAVPGLPNGQASLVEGLRATGAAREALPLQDLGEGDFRIAGGRRIHLSYAVRLEHDRYPWPAGMEEVSYRTAEGVMATGATLFFADGDAPVQAPIEVSFDLPRGWRAQTPWRRIGTGERFAVDSRRELLSNALFLGTAQEQTFEAGGVTLTLVLGERYRKSAPLFVDLLRTQLASYAELFGAPPPSKRYLVIVNEHASGDGGAFASSFSQFVQGDADERNRVLWGYVMAHELLHFWNGLGLVPADAREEWFKEGATDYLTIVTLARNGWLADSLLSKRLENVPRRVVLARRVQGLRMSVRDAGKDKQANRLLVYGGGSLAALALDVALRERSGDRVGLPDFMRALYASHGKPGSPYALADLVRVASTLTGQDFTDVFYDAVGSEDDFDIRPSYAALGLRMDGFLDEVFISHEPNATEAQRARFEAIFGRQPARRRR